MDTMRRWIKDIFTVNNIVNFSPHSCQAASSSKAKHIDVNIDEIIRRGCWKDRKNFLKLFLLIYELSGCGFKSSCYAPDDIDFNIICRV